MYCLPFETCELSYFHFLSNTHHDYNILSQLWSPLRVWRGKIILVLHQIIAPTPWTLKMGSRQFCLVPFCEQTLVSHIFALLLTVLFWKEELA